MSKLLSSSTIAGTDVKNLAGQNLGNIKDLMIDPKQGNVRYAVLSFGGFLGLGDKYFAIPWESFSVDRDDESMILNVTQEKLENAPGFDKDDWPTDATHDYLTSVNKYYSPEYY